MPFSFSRLTSGRTACPSARRLITRPTRRQLTTVTLNDDALIIPSLKNAAFPYIWLRDSCQSPGCKHPTTTQKLHSSTDFDVDIRPRTVKITKHEAELGLHIEWPDGHVSFFPKSFLERHSSKDGLSSFRKDVEAETWDREDIEKNEDFFLKYKDIKTPRGLLKAIDQLCRYGLLFVQDVPTEPEISLNDLALGFSSEIRETFYGRIFNVQNTNSENIAYTNLKLGLHMDLLYFEHPPRFQILHCLQNKVQGGTSVFSDSFHAAKTLKSFYPEDYELLAKTPVPFEYVHGEHHLYNMHPTIELDLHSPASSYPPIKCVNYSPPFQGSLLLSSPSTLRRFYFALGRFANMLNSPEHTYEYTLQEGDAVIFDNRRVLHARTAFREHDARNSSSKEISRWLQGCYFEGDTLKDRGRVLRAKKSAGMI